MLVVVVVMERMRGMESACIRVGVSVRVCLSIHLSPCICVCMPVSVFASVTKAVG